MTRIEQIANQTIPRGTNQVTITEPKGNTRDIMRDIITTDNRSGPFTNDFARFLAGKDRLTTAANIWHFIKTHIEYRVDPLGFQFIKLPSQTWSDRFGDCKSFSIFAGSILKNLGIPYSYRFVSFSPVNVPTHVYVVVPGAFSEIIIDPVFHSFNAQKPFTFKTDIDMNTVIATIEGLRTSQVAGIGQLTDQDIEIDLGSDQDWARGIIDEAEFELRLDLDRIQLYQANARRVSGIGQLTTNVIDAQADELKAALDILKRNRNDRKELERELILLETAKVEGFGIFKKIGKAIKKGVKAVGKVGKKVVRGAGKALKFAGKVVTAPLRLAMKGILSISLPKAAPAFLYLFASPSQATKFPAKARAKRSKMERRFKFITQTIGMRESTVKKILRNGIIKQMGQEPEIVIANAVRKRGISGIGGLPVAIIQTLIQVIKKIASIFKKKVPADKFSADDLPDLDADFAELINSQPDVVDNFAGEIINDSPLPAVIKDAATKKISQQGDLMPTKKDNTPLLIGGGLLALLLLK